MPTYSHLHCHTQYSLLDGASSIKGMIAKAKADNMPAVAITDHGNMFGVFEFVNEAEKAGVKPIVGCEFYLVEDRFKKTFTKTERDQRYHQLLLAKDQSGYQNLAKLCSLGYLEGQYSKYPRIDKDLLRQYKDGLIATTCCIGAEVPQAILRHGEEKAEKLFLEWLDLFGDDYYIELQRHGLKNLDGTGISQEDINHILIKWSNKYKVSYIATNDSHYLDERDADAHDILLCVNTGEKKSTPVGDGKGYRFGFPNNKFFFKTQAEMLTVFSDIPEALDNTNLIIDKITPPKLKRDVLLPNFTLPQGFKTQGEYLKFLTYEGAKKRYGELTAAIIERIEFELNVVEQSGYPGYFLIVQDFTTVARQLGVWVGPGRGSAAGSVIAYCVGITNVDPMKYGLLFERFLNPERVSMPDIDIDFDDQGRDKVIDYVIKKYGERQVAQIITYGTMAAKSSLRDVGRVLDLPLDTVNSICKTFPDNLSASLQGVLHPNGLIDKFKESFNDEQKFAAEKFRQLAANGDDVAKVINTAVKLEGSVRNTGVHACGVIITPEDITNLIPVAVAKDTNFIVTQYDNNLVESAGLLKMDFLGLKTLSIMKDAIAIIKQRHSIEIDLDTLPLTDEKTFELFQKGNTAGIFQFESPGMQKYLKDLKPNKFEDLIAMNALYRPGPLEYIPDFIRRKHGFEPITYDLEVMQFYLEETYGITVYQEQVMLLSQVMANFTKGDADTLRKAMGKKQRETLDKMKGKFLAGCQDNGHDLDICNKVWTDWEKFAAYAFNKSHSTCYALIAYQTAYLKAHYPAEFMASVLTHNMDNIKNVTFFVEESRKMNVKVLGPDVNESVLNFTVNSKGEIRFGLGGIKGVGEAAVQCIISERDVNKRYRTIFDFAERVDLRTVNKKTFESLAMGGGFDELENIKRAQLLVSDDPANSPIEKIIRYGNSYQASKASMQNSLFGSSSEMIGFVAPELPEVEELSLFRKLQLEKETLGFYVSGHPLDEYRREMAAFASHSIDKLDGIMHPVDVALGVMITEVNHREAKTGKGFSFFTIEDKTESYKASIFGESYLKFKHLLEVGTMVFMRGQMRPSYRNPNMLELNISHMELLAETARKLTKSLSFKLNIGDIDNEMVDKLNAIVNKFPGHARLSFNIFDAKNNLLLPLFSDYLTVNPVPDMFEELDRIEGLEYQLSD